MRVGVFDSGVGGLSVVKSLMEHKIFSEIIYYGDTARVPYGSKDKNTIIRYAIEAVEFFYNFDIDLLITACNSVSAYALSEMREAANCAVYGVIEPGIIATANALKDKEAKIFVIGTKATIASKRYEEGLRDLGFHNIISMPTPLFVPLVEEGLFRGELLEATLKHYFHDIATPDAIILGCTHFPLISDAISNYFENRPIMIHSGDAIVEYLERKYPLTKRFKQTELKLFASQNPKELQTIANRWLSI